MLPVNVKINQYQWKYPRLMAKYKTGIYKSDYFYGGSNKILTF